jgi:hypothetical protein
MKNYFKILLLNLRAFNPFKQYFLNFEYKKWEQKGKPAPPPHLLKQKVINEGLNELLKDVSSWNMNADGLYKQSIPSSNVKLSGQQNLLLKYSVAAQPVKRKLKT